MRVENTQLLSRPIAFPDESAGSIMLRATEKSGWSTPDSLFNSFYSLKSYTPKISTILANKEHFYYLCSVSGIDTSANESICSYRINEGAGADFMFYKIKVHHSLIHINSSALCPECASSNRYLKKTWDHRFITACTKHHVKLIEHCPHCKDAIRWNRASTYKCQCGYDLRTAVSSIIDSTEIKYIEDIFTTHNENEYQDLTALYYALLDYYQVDKNAPVSHDIVSLAALGTRDPHSLARALVLELLDYWEDSFIPRIAMAVLLHHPSKCVSDIGEKAVELMSFTEFSKSSESYHIDNYVPISIAATTLGIEKKHVKELIEHDLLQGMKSDINSSVQVLKSSLHDLMLKLCNSSVESPLPTDSIMTAINAPRETRTFIDFIFQIIEGDIKAVGFNLKEKMADLRIIHVNIPIPDTEELFLVTPKDLSIYCGVPIGTLRQSVKKGKISYFTGGITHGVQKYITMEDAVRYAYSYTSNLRNKDKKLFYQAISIDELKLTKVIVTYPR